MGEIEILRLTQGLRPGDFLNVDAQVRRTDAWVIVHDVSEDRWELWKGGKCLQGVLASETEAVAAIRQYLA